MRKVLMIFLASSLLLAAIACGSSTPEKQPEKQVAIEGIGWTLYNVDPSFWSDGSPESALVGFGIYLSGTRLVANDIKEVTITAPTEKHWSWPRPQQSIADRFDVKHQVFTAPWLYVPAYDDGSCLPIGTYSFDIQLSNGTSASKTLLIPAPGQTTTAGAAFVFTENYLYADNPPPGFTPLPKRATIQSAIIDFAQSTLDIDFSVSDGLVYSGWVEFYNTNGDYIGYIGTVNKPARFRDYFTDKIASYLNGGSAFHTDGTTNTVSLKKAQLYFEDSASFEDVAFVRLILTDGKQYASTDYGFDTMSISAAVGVTK